MTMKSPLLRTGLVLAALMFAATALAVVLKPTNKISNQSTGYSLDQITPRSFGDWREVPSNTVVLVNPQQQEVLDAVYSETLSRTYIHKDGSRIMLSLAYGTAQSRQDQVHRPEICYPAQGFQLKDQLKDTVDTAFGPLPVMRLLAEQGQRKEPITYWIRVGDDIVRGNLEQGIARLRYGIRGNIPDGLLVRVSSLSSDPTVAFTLQDRFISEFLNALTKMDASKFIGKYAMLSADGIVQ